VVGRADQEDLVAHERHLVDRLEEGVDRAFRAACSSERRVFATESNSSMKRIHGESRFATSKVFSTFLAVSPRYWLVIIDIFTSTSGIPSSCASARETVVFPVPGGPTNSSFPDLAKPDAREVLAVFDRFHDLLYLALLIAREHEVSERRLDLLGRADVDEVEHLPVLVLVEVLSRRASIQTRFGLDRSDAVARLLVGHGRVEGRQTPPARRRPSDWRRFARRRRGRDTTPAPSPAGSGYLAGEFRPLGKEQVGNGVPRVLNARCGAGCLARRLERAGLDAARGVVGGVIRPEHLSEARRQVVLVEVAVLGVEVRRQHELDDVERRVTHPREVAAGRG